MAVPRSSSAISLFFYGVIALVLYTVGVVIYRLKFHPLAKVPGPKLAAATWLYQTYYGGGYTRKIEELHRQYGSVVRITPNEVILSNIANHDKIYSLGSKYGKDPLFYGIFATPSSAFTAASNRVHRVQRSALNPFFSRKKVLELEDVVQSKVQKLCRRISQESQVGDGVVELHYGLKAISVDVISDYAFGECYDLLEKEDYDKAYFSSLHTFASSFWFFQAFPGVQKVLMSLPDAITKRLSSAASAIVGLTDRFSRNVLQAKENMMRERGMGPNTTIFHQLSQPDEKHPEYVIPTVKELTDEAVVILAAASDTTGAALIRGTYHVLNNVAIHERLIKEIASACPDPDKPLPFLVLERLPFLAAVIKETLRMVCAVPGRLPRVVPEPGDEFDGYKVPAGTVVGMSAYNIHHNPDIFPDPYTFNPERWLDTSTARGLEKYLVAFGKGQRQCVGMPLAYCELYVTLATVIYRFPHLKVYNTTAKDLELEDFFSGHISLASNLFAVTNNIES